MVEEVRYQDNVIARAKIALKCIARDRVITIGNAKLLSIFLRDGQNLIPVGAVDLCIRIFVCRPLCRKCRDPQQCPAPLIRGPSSKPICSATVWAVGNISGAMLRANSTHISLSGSIDASPDYAGAAFSNSVRQTRQSRVAVAGDRMKSTALPIYICETFYRETPRSHLSKLILISSFVKNPMTVSVSQSIRTPRSAAPAAELFRLRSIAARRSL